MGGNIGRTPFHGDVKAMASRGGMLYGSHYYLMMMVYNFGVTPVLFWYPRLRDSYENGALMTLSVRGRATKRDSGHHFWAIEPTREELTKGPPSRRPTPYCHPFLPEPAKLIATDFGHTSCHLCDRYIYTYVHLILFLGFGRVFVEKSQC